MMTTRIKEDTTEPSAPVIWRDTNNQSRSALPPELQAPPYVAVRPKHERRRTVADDLYKKLVEDHESFWNIVYPLYMRREITRGNVRDMVQRGLEDARGNYRLVTRLFNIDPREYRKFLNFLRKHDCQLPFKEYR